MKNEKNVGFIVLLLTILAIKSHSFIFENISFIAPTIFLILLVSLLFLTKPFFREIKDFTKKIKKRTILILGIIVLFGFVVRLSAPHYFHMYTDDFTNSEIAKNIILQQKGVLCEFNFEEIVCRNYDQPIGWPYILSLSYAIFGVNSFVGTYVNSLIGALSIILIFVLTYLITRDEKASLFTSLIMSFFKLHIFYSASANSIVPATFFALITIIGLILYVKKRNPSLLSFTIISYLLTIFIRVEYALIGIVIVLYLILKKSLNKEVIKSSLLFTPIIVIFMINILNFLGHQYNRTFGLELLSSQLPYELKLIFASYYFPLVMLIFFFLGFLYSKNIREKIVLLAWFVLFELFYVSWHYSQQDRFFIFSFIPIFIFMGMGFSWISNKLKRVKLINTLIIILVLAVLFNSVKGISHSDNILILETQVTEMIKEDIHKDCYIITHKPTIIQSSNNYKTISMHTFLQNQNKLNMLEGCVLFHENYYCLQNKKICSSVKINYSLQKEFEYKSKYFTNSFYMFS